MIDISIVSLIRGAESAPPKCRPRFQFERRQKFVDKVAHGRQQTQTVRGFGEQSRQGERERLLRAIS